MYAVIHEQSGEVRMWFSTWAEAREYCSNCGVVYVPGAHTPSGSVHAYSTFCVVYFD